jgi:hypothetical protein
MNESLRHRLKSLLGSRLTTKARCLVRGKPLPRWGNLRRLKPFSENFGFDRGTPVDRYYLNRFLKRNTGLIRGRVLEIQSPGYTKRFGSELIEAHSVDIDGSHHPTFVCDLAESEGVIPSDRYDCFLLPNTLSVLKNIEGCLRHALRIVKPGGAILASTAGLAPLIPDGPDYWRHTKAGWEVLLERLWPNCEIAVEGHGNCLVAVAEMLQLSMEELTEQELEFHDPRYPVLVTMSCRKPT